MLLTDALARDARPGGGKNGDRHSTGNITAHYSMAQLAELHRAVRLVESPANRWNKTLSTLKKEAQARAIHAKSTQQRCA